MVATLTEHVLTIETVVIHDVPRGGSDSAAVTLTDAPIGIDAELRQYFKSKVATSLEHSGVDVVIDSSKDPTVTNAVVTILDDPSTIVEQSKLIATRLDKVQTAINPAGLLTVIYGKLGEKPALAILKLEREEGIRFQVHRVEGRLTVDLQFLRDLTLTNKTKVFKTSLFTLPNPNRPSSLIGSVSDDQRGKTQGRGVAEFFLGTFLGTRLAINPARATYEFVQAAEEFINERIRDPITKGRYQVALLATLQSPQDQIVPDKFGTDHLQPQHRDEFRAYVEQHQIPAASPFRKDLSLTPARGFRMTFENGMVLTGSSVDFTQRLEIHSGNTAPGVTVNDAIATIRNR
jgi:hypothetical protein